MRTVLLTGATGAIGSVLAQYLASEPDTRLHLLLRAHSPSHLSQRLRELYAFWGLDPNDRATTGRVEAHAGDVTLPKLGLGEAEFHRLTRDVTHLIHSAGNVKLNRPLDEARRSAVGSAAHVLSFVDTCRRHGPFQKFEYVSTVGVAGRMPGMVPERIFPEPRCFRNTYEAAKAEAEQLVFDEIGRGLPATIHRPSMVVGDSHDGRIIQFQVFYYLCEFLSGRRTAGIVPRTGDIRLDIVPVDYVARAIQVSSRHVGAVGRIFHLCAGPMHAPRIADLAVHVREFFVAHGLRAPRLRPMSPALMRRLLPVVGVLSPRKVRRTLQSLPHFLAYLAEAQVFDNAKSVEFFAAAGVKLPAVDHYLDAVLSHYVSQTTGHPVRVSPQVSQGAA